MTFDVFEKLALNPPYTIETSVYRMDIFQNARIPQEEC